MNSLREYENGDRFIGYFNSQKQRHGWGRYVCTSCQSILDITSSPQMRAEHFTRALGRMVCLVPIDRLLISCTRVQVWIRGAASATRGQLLWVRSAPQYVSAERAPYLRCSCARGWRDNLKTGLGMYLFSNGGTRPDQFLGQLKSLINFLPVFVSVFVLS